MSYPSIIFLKRGANGKPMKVDINEAKMDVTEYKHKIKDKTPVVSSKDGSSKGTSNESGSSSDSSSLDSTYVSTKNELIQDESSVDNSSKSDSSKTQNKNKEIKQKILEAIVNNINSRIFNTQFETLNIIDDSALTFSSNSQSDSGSDSESESKNKGLYNSGDPPDDTELSQKFSDYSGSFSYDTDKTPMKSYTFSTDSEGFVADSPIVNSILSTVDDKSEKQKIKKEKCEETFNETSKDPKQSYQRKMEIDEKIGGNVSDLTYDNIKFKQIPIAGDGDCLFTSVLTGYLMIDKDNWDSMLGKTHINIGSIDLNQGQAAIKFTNANIRSMIENYVCRKRDDIQEKQIGENNKLSEKQIEEILKLGKCYGGDNEIMVLSNMLNKKILVIKPIEGSATYRLFNSDFSQDPEPKITELLNQGDDKPQPIILHNTGSENKNVEDLQDCVAEHFNLLLTQEQYIIFERTIKRLENLRNGVRDATENEIINRIIPRDNNSL